MKKDLTDGVKYYISKGNTKKAIDILLREIETSDSMLDQVLLISGEYNSIQADYVKGLFDESKKTNKINKINARLLSLVTGNNTTDATISIPKDLNHIPYINEEKLIGREDELLLMESKLNGRPLLVYGIRGIGKTTLCKGYLSHYRNNYNYVLWIDATNGIKESMVCDQTLTANLGSHIFEFVNSKIPQLDQSFNQITEKLKNLKPESIRTQKNLIIFDNVKDFKELLRVQGLFPKSQWEIIITSFEYSPNYEENNIHVDTLDNQNAKKLFLANSKWIIKKYDESTLNFILAKVGHHTLTIDLLGKACATNPDYNLDKIFSLLSQNNFDKPNFNLEIRTGHNQYEKSVKLYSYIESIFEFNKLDGNEEIILEVFSILPPIKISGSVLLDGFSPINIRFNKLIYFLNVTLNIFSKEKTMLYDRNGLINSINSLLEKGWLSHDGDKYKCSEIIREIVYQKVKKSPLMVNLYEKILNRISVNTHYNGDFFNSFMICNNIINLLESRKENVIYEKHLNTYYIRAALNLGNIGLTPVAKFFMEKCTGYIKNKPIEYKVHFFIEEARIYLIENDIKTFNSKLKIIQSIISKIELNKSNSNAYIRYNNLLGNAASRKGNNEQAIKYYLKAISICDKFDPYSLEKCRIHSNIGKTYFQIKEYIKSREHLLESLALSKKIYGNNEHPYDKENLKTLKKVNRFLKLQL